MWNNDTCWCKCKKGHICKKDHICIPSSCNFKKAKYLAIIIDDSIVMCDEIVDVKAKRMTEKQKQLQQTLMKKMQLIKHKVSIFYLSFINWYCIIESS